MRNVWTTAACLLMMSVISRGADNPLLQNVDRRIQKEPGYIAKRPLYGLLVFGPARRSASGWYSTIRSRRRSVTTSFTSISMLMPT